MEKHKRNGSQNLAVTIQTIQVPDGSDRLVRALDLILRAGQASKKTSQPPDDNKEETKDDD